MGPEGEFDHLPPPSKAEVKFTLKQILKAQKGEEV